MIKRVAIYVTLAVSALLLVAAAGYELNRPHAHRAAAVKHVTLTPSEAGVAFAHVYNSTPPVTTRVMRIVACMVNPHDANQFRCVTVVQSARGTGCALFQFVVQTQGNQEQLKMQLAKPLAKSYCA